MSNKLSWFIVALLMGLTLLLPSATQAQENTLFQPTDCPFTPFIGLQEGINLECGYVDVPQYHADPAAATIRLSVAIIDSLNNDPAPDPVFVAQGGPGGSTIDIYGAKAPQLLQALRQNRDVVLFDQRGALHTEPNLLCSELFELTAEIIDEDLSLEESTEMELAALRDCRRRLSNQGTDLAAYNSLENAADVAYLRRALGYERYNFYGVSYGTLLALHLMRDHPQGLRSVILDAVVPPQINFITESPASLDRAFTVLFDACTNQPACATTYPNLERRFFDLVDRLQAQPITVPVLDPVTGNSYDAVVNGEALEGTLFQLLYVTDFIPLLPKAIVDTEQGNTNILSVIISTIAFDRTFSIGMYNSVICAEDADFTVADMETEGIRPRLAESVEVEYGLFLEMCEQWDVPEIGPAFDAPTVSDIPTLLLSGQFDPITPQPFATAAAETLTTSYSYLFPIAAHSALGTACADTIVSDFLDSPNRPPDASCLENEPDAPEFVTPANTLMLPLLGDLLRLSTNGWLQIGGLLLFSGGLLSAWLVWPIVTLIRLFVSDKMPPPLAAHLAKWLSLLTGLVNGAFLVGVTVVVGTVIFENEALLLAGLPRTLSTTLLFGLPMVTLLMTVWLTITTVISWREGYWSIWERLYQTLLTIAAFGCVILLTSTGFLLAAV